MTEWLERWTCNLEAPSSSPTLTASLFVFCSPKFKSSTTLVNSQLVCLRPTGTLNPAKFDLDHLLQAFAGPH